MDADELKSQLEEHHALSYGWALNCCGQNPANAADVLQAAYLKILDGRAQFNGKSGFKTWLFAVVRNTAAAERRRHWLSLSRLGEYFRERAQEAEAVEAEDFLESSETAAQFQTALARLPRRQREVLHLVFYQDLTIEEAAGVMGVGLGSARTHYERGKQRLREWLNKSKHDNEHERNRQQVPETLS